MVLVTGIILGLASNLHCIGMCGPIVMAIPVNRQSNYTIFRDSLFYNIGRISTYAILGSIVGSIGLSVSSLGALQWISIVAGILLILFAWRKYLSKWIPIVHLDFGIHSFFSSSMGKILKSGSMLKLPLLGALNGLLPCGMVFLALGNAILGGDILSGALAMLAFGIGTLPGMLVVAILSNKISPNIRLKLSRSVPLVLTIVGALTIVRGLNLGIAYVSPKIEVINNPTSKGKTIEASMSCCHSKEQCD